MTNACIIPPADPASCRYDQIERNLAMPISEFAWLVEHDRELCARSSAANGSPSGTTRGSASGTPPRKSPIRQTFAAAKAITSCRPTISRLTSFMAALNGSDNGLHDSPQECSVSSELPELAARHRIDTLMSHEVASILELIRKLPPAERVLVADEVDRLAWSDRVQRVVDDVGASGGAALDDVEIDRLVRDVRTEKSLSERYWTRRRRSAP